MELLPGFLTIPGTFSLNFSFSECCSISKGLFWEELIHWLCHPQGIPSEPLKILFYLFLLFKTALDGETISTTTDRETKWWRHKYSPPPLFSHLAVQITSRNNIPRSETIFIQQYLSTTTTKNHPPQEQLLATYTKRRIRRYCWLHSY